MFASSVQAVVACYATVPRVCTLVLFICSALIGEKECTKYSNEYSHNYIPIRIQAHPEIQCIEGRVSTIYIQIA